MHSLTTTVDGLDLHVRTLGEGPPVLLLHGWPTSSFLWRNVMPGVAAAGRTAVAPDLPGFGRSAKPLDADYGFAFFERILEGLVATLEAPRIGLVVHDLGGPVGLRWATRHPERVERVAILNTVVYPDPALGEKLFMRTVDLPLLRRLWTSSPALRLVLRLGVHDRARLPAEAVDAVLEASESWPARRAMARPWGALDRDGFQQIAAALPSLGCPVRLIYGEEDRILPGVARTMERLARDLPRAELTALPECGHFLQEERPEELSALLADFFR